jgi:ABC-type multidrug transport system ATPase subunit
MNDSASIVVQNPDKFFGKQKVLKNVDLSIDQGSIYGLIVVGIATISLREKD